MSMHLPDISRGLAGPRRPSSRDCGHRGSVAMHAKRSLRPIRSQRLAPTLSGRSRFSDGVTGPTLSPAIRRDRGGNREPRKAVVAVRAWLGGEYPAAFEGLGPQLTTHRCSRRFSGRTAAPDKRDKMTAERLHSKLAPFAPDRDKPPAIFLSADCTYQRVPTCCRSWN